MLPPPLAPPLRGGAKGAFFCFFNLKQKMLRTQRKQGEVEEEAPDQRQERIKIRIKTRDEQCYAVKQEELLKKNYSFFV
jgi:hypothetical protein